MKTLEYPFKPEELLRKRKKLKTELLASGTENFNKIKIAVLCGSSARDVIEILELFLLDNGFAPEFYEGDYNRYYEEAFFDNKELDAFQPDIVYIHTTSRNIKKFPDFNMEEGEIKAVLEKEYRLFEQMWSALKRKYNCVIIQNNFEMTIERNFGNMDAVNIHGRLHYINALNALFYDYALKNDNFRICDINYLSACYGLKAWSDSKYWFLYKYALNVKAIPYLSYAVYTLIKSIYGRNKKCVVVDLDNTLWGGVVAEDGIENIQVGKETAEGEMYSDVQRYLQKLKDMGILLAVASKNEKDIAVEALNSSFMTIKEEDFASVKADFNRKDQNIISIAEELNVLPDSMVFLDDNPAELMLVKDSIENVAVVSSERCENIIPDFEMAGFFEIASLTQDDMQRNAMYNAEKQRRSYACRYNDYGEYLQSLDMHAVISPFTKETMQRIAQLSNKSNQFNLTTHRYTQPEIEAIAANENYITLCGRLEDKFGDNGIVSVIIGKKEVNTVYIELWLMSCRVLKRDMELAMFDSLVGVAKELKIERIVGVYIPTNKNKMVKDFYEQLGFCKYEEEQNGITKWEIAIKDCMEKRNKYILVS